MELRSITLQEFTSVLQSFRSQPIWRVIHPADGWLLFDLGEEYQGRISGVNGEERPYPQGQFQLTIRGDWRLWQNSVLVNSREVQENETQKEYFERLEKLVQNFSLTAFEKIEITRNLLSFFQGDSRLDIDFSLNFDVVTLTYVDLDAQKTPVKFTHYRFDKEKNSLVEVTA